MTARLYSNDSIAKVSETAKLALQKTDELRSSTNADYSDTKHTGTGTRCPSSNTSTH